jgi:hypothetical protein
MAEPEEIEVAVNFRLEPPAVMVDVVNIASSEDMFAVLLCQVSPFRPPTQTDAGPRVELRPISSVRLLPDHFESALDNMIRAYNRWAASNGRVTRYTKSGGSEPPPSTP